MRILVVNPNTTASMTRKIGVAAQRAAAPGTQIVAINPAHGPASIEGYYDEALSCAQDFDAVVIACFDDTGLDALRCLTDKPVVGIGEAAYRVAAMLCNKFSVVTTLARSVPALEHNLRRYGMQHQCQRVRSSEVAVLDLEDAQPEALNKIRVEIALALQDDRAEAIVLGCAGMADLAHSMSVEFGVPVLDGLACAVALCEGMVRLGVRTSRRGGYAPPPAAKMTLAAQTA
jgi:allantoin racemase